MADNEPTGEVITAAELKWPDPTRPIINERLDPDPDEIFGGDHQGVPTCGEPRDEPDGRDR